MSDREVTQQAEPVACRFCHSKKGCWAWQCYKCGEIDDVQQLAPQSVQEDAFEGWVKIDEVREHFNAVNCGTIYRHGGEGRVLLRAAPPKREWQGLTNEEIRDCLGPEAVRIPPGWSILTRAIEAKLKERNK